MVNWPAFLTDPLRGKTSLNRVFWLYGVGGSLLYGALELFLDPGSVLATRLYAVGGLAIGVYTAVATYRCAGNCRSKFWMRMAQVSAVLSLVLLPVFFYLDLTGALGLSALGLQ
jgi:hypothetical protein